MSRRPSRNQDAACHYAGLGIGIFGGRGLGYAARYSACWCSRTQKDVENQTGSGRGLLILHQWKNVGRRELRNSAMDFLRRGSSGCDSLVGLLYWAGTSSDAPRPSSASVSAPCSMTNGGGRQACNMRSRCAREMKIEPVAKFKTDG